ncbi:hypothetical protein, partial [Achromobacter xylosoxidans]|uniref:hypothetical protein n=1 Tax=Alcaligenes xylosoxydans xylosoxydans TaxID=85698 RepID=UPI001F102C0A
VSLTSFGTRKRPDTIRCIVASLVNSEDDDLDLTAGIGPDDRDDDDGGIKPLQTRDEREEDYSDPNWVPEPIDAAPGTIFHNFAIHQTSSKETDFKTTKEFRSGKASDIISTLVSIYDTRDSIVKELQVLLAQR